MTGPAREVLTVGHSTHPLEEFLALLDGAGAAAVVDVRRLPGSRRFPWFDEEPLRASLAEHGIAYHRIPELAGRRGAQRDVPPELNAFWQNRSFHNYADHALGEEFAAGIEALLGVATRARPAVMCAEAVWWRCHRRIIADHLIARGVPVRHLMPDGRLAEAAMTRGAVPAGGRVTYPGPEAAEPAPPRAQARCISSPRT